MYLNHIMEPLHLNQSVVGKGRMIHWHQLQLAPALHWCCLFLD